MLPRILQLTSFLKHKSLFLLGPRQVGKTTYLRTTFPDAHFIDLLESETYRTLARSPETLRQWVSHKQGLVVIDEIQRLPGLLNEVQLLIDRNKDLRFILTGSSARKLRRGSTNLLGGRALSFHLFPLVSKEYGVERVDEVLQQGSLPSVVDSPIAQEELRAYVGTYLKEEVQAEGLTRSIGNFSRFLDFAAHFNAEVMNYTKIGNDAQVAPRTVKDYITILEDTLVAHRVSPFKTRNKGRKTVSMEKLYFFDIGVTNTLLGRTHLQKGTTEYGKALEQLVFLELSAYREYRRLDYSLCFWRTHNQWEVDFVIDDHTAIEVKATGRISQRDLKGLRGLAEETSLKKKIVVCTEPRRRITEDGIEIMPFGEFLSDLWEEQIFET